LEITEEKNGRNLENQAYSKEAKSKEKEK